MARRKFTKAQLKAVRAKREADRETFTDYENDLQVLTLTQWCRLNNFSISTGQRRLRAPDAPPVIQISDKRFGITVGANRVWQARRMRRA
jgi:hypothetical protein